MFLHTYDIHCPYRRPKPFRHMFTGDYEPSYDLTRCGNPHLNELPLDQKDFEYVSALYDGGIRYTDKMLRVLFELLDELDLLETSIIVITSDHGECLGERGWIGHGHGVLQEELLKVPLIMRIPGRRPQVISEPVSLIDLLPTLLSLLGIEPVEGSNPDGLDLSPVLAGEFSFQGKRPRLCEAGENQAFLVDSQWRLVMNHESELPELYNQKKDPLWTQDAAASHPEVAQGLHEQLKLLLESGQVADVVKDEERPSMDPRLKEQLRALGYVAP